MGKYTVELSDVDGNACKVQLSLPFAKRRTAKDNSTWKTLDQGMIKYHSGGCNAVGTGRFEVWGLQLLVGDNYIVTLSGILDALNLLNDSGSGTIEQVACVGFKPGKITWAVLE